MTNAEEFMRWVSDPARTDDELFTVELLLEQSRGYNWPFAHVDGSFEAKRERTRERRLNPGHRPSLHTDELRALSKQTETLNHFSGGASDDRPMRNVEALRFFPALKHLGVQSSDVTDFRPIATLSDVEYFSIAEYGDLYGCHPIVLAQCGTMPKLQRVHFALRHPWPDVRALAQWPMIDINFSGNVLALEEVEIFSAAENVALKNWPSGRVDVRNLSRLPEMPKARRLTVETTASLQGIERYPTVVNLDVQGCFNDLTPLATMEITALTLRSERFHDLRPLAQMPRLREITFVREWPLDLSPLAECPQLRRVDFQNCTMMRTEVGALNAGLLPESLDFLVEQPRPLAPLRSYELAKDDKEGSEFFRERENRIDAERKKFYDGDLAFQKAEERAFVAAMQEKFDALLGRGWGIFRVPFVNIRRFADTVRTLELVQIVREFSAQWRWPLKVTFIVEPHGDMTDDMEEIRARDAAATEPDGDYLLKYYERKSVLAENEEGRRQREERYEVLKREHLRRLLGEAAGDLVYLRDESAGEEPEEPEEEEPLSSADEDDDGEGGVAIAPPPPPPPGENTLSDDLMFYLDVYEDCVVANSNWIDRARYSLALPFVTWTAAEGESLR